MRTDDRRIPANVLAELSTVDTVERQTRELAEDIRDDAVNLAPVRTGNLKRRGIATQRVKDQRTGLVSYRVGWTDAGWYGWMVERGTEHSTPRPHLVPAAVKHGARPVRGSSSDPG